MRNLVRAALAVFVLAASGCGPSKELTRDKALELLKAGPPELLSDAVWDGALYWWRFDDDNAPPHCTWLKKLAFSERLDAMKVVTRSVVVTPPFRSPYQRPRSGMTDYAFQVIDPTFAKGSDSGQPAGQSIS